MLKQGKASNHCAANSNECVCNARNSPAVTIHCIDLARHYTDEDGNCQVFVTLRLQSKTSALQLQA